MGEEQGDMVRLICVHCGGNESFMWPCTDEEEMCSECQAPNPANKEIKYDSNDKEEDMEKTEINNESSDDEFSIAKAMEKGTRKRKRVSRQESNSPIPSTSRAFMVEEDDQDLEEPPNKAPAVDQAAAPAVALDVPPAVASSIVISDHIFFKGRYMQAGDVVSITDVEGGTYYAQIRHFVSAQHTEGAVITWLLPTRASPHPDIGFAPATYMTGPEEDAPRKLDYMQYVMHLPTDYYRNRNIPAPLTDAEINRCYG